MTDRNVGKAIREISSWLVESFSSEPEAYKNEIIRFGLILDLVTELAKNRGHRALADTALRHSLYWFEQGDREFASAVQKTLGSELDGYMKILETYCLAPELEVSERSTSSFESRLVGVARAEVR
jgi:hypothetical protein